MHKQSDKHLINVLIIGSEHIATCRCGWKHSCESLRDHMAAVNEHTAAVKDHLGPRARKDRTGSGSTRKRER